MLKKILAVAFSLLLLFSVAGYFAWEEKSGFLPEDQTKVYSVKEQMDMAMKNARDPKVLATVNGEEINQTDMDMYSIEGNK